MIMVALEQAIRTNNIKAKIDKSQENSKCKIIGKAEDSENHALSECSKFAQKEYELVDDMIGLERSSIGKYVENMI